MNLVKNEIKKIILSKKYIIAMSIFLILYSGVTFLICRDTMNLKPEILLNKNKTYMEYLKKEKKSGGASQKRKAEIDNTITEIEMHNESLRFEVKNKNINWRKRLIKQNKDLNKQLNLEREKDNVRKVATYNQEVKTNEYYLKHNIEPTLNYEITAFNIMPKVNIFVGLLIISVIIAIIVSDSVSGEFNSSTIKLLLTKPVSREQVLFSKFLASIITCVLSFMIVEVLVFIILGMVFKFGSFKEPIVFYSNYIKDRDMIAKTGFGVLPDLNSLKICSIMKLTVLSELFNILFITCMVSLCILFSTLAKKSSTSISISVILFSIISVLTTSQLDGGAKKNGILGAFMPYLFSSYSSGEFIVTREIVKKLGVDFVNVPFIIGILIAWTVVCYAVSNFIFTRKDILS
ncbi:ABC transporter permease subunit [Clostridium niameyense]|uniref:ABC transporter permease subunit n=1 Tax=Clostridium niameyense TaxID=1622073 RepID=UPI00067EDBE4|nr:ABC transporter permease subunit [Clostridium niameyense]